MLSLVRPSIVLPSYHMYHTTFNYKNCVLFQNSYLTVSRQLKRMVGITTSPINSFLTESYSGAATIRAYKMEDIFIEENGIRVETNQGPML
jgi:hypothetical protein